MAIFETIKHSGLFAIPMCVVFVTSGLFVNCAQFLLYFTVAQVNLNTFRRINQSLVTLNWALMVWLAESFAGLKIRHFGKPEDWNPNIGKNVTETVKNDRALCLVNHRSDIDWLIGWMLAERFNMLGGTKAFMKSGARLFPILGWTWDFCEFIWLRRDWNKDKEAMDSGIRQLQDYPLPYWAVLFPEGTRYTPKKHLASQEFARSKGLPVLHHLLSPRPRGFVFAVKSLRHDVDAVYRCTVAFKDYNPPTLVSMLKATPGEIHVYIEKSDPKDLPTEEKELTDWLNESFVSRDKLLAYHMEHNIFPGEETIIPTTMRPKIITIGWAFLHAAFLVWYFYSCIHTGNYHGLRLLGGFFVIAAIISIILISVSAADKTKVEKKE